MSVGHAWDCGNGGHVVGYAKKNGDRHLLLDGICAGHVQNWLIPPLHMARADSTCNYDNMRGIAETAGAWSDLPVHRYHARAVSPCPFLCAMRRTR